MRRPARNTSAYSEVPKNWARTRSRTSPAIRLRRIPAATTLEARPDAAGSGGLGTTFLVVVVLMPCASEPLPKLLLVRTHALGQMTRERLAYGSDDLVEQRRPVPRQERDNV